MSHYVWFVRGARHAAMARVSIGSVRRANPGAECHVFTDGPLDVLRPHLAGAGNLVQFASHGAPIMLANIAAQCEALASFARGERVTFLDTDVLALGELPAGGDLTVTWRDHIGRDAEGQPVQGIATSQPYNYGVLGATAGYKALQAFIWMRERVRVMSPNLRKWFGNQVALAALAGPAPATGAIVEGRRIPWTLTEYGDPITVQKLPCERWNYTPQQAGERIHGLRSFLHFKGPKRALMRSYAEGLGIDWPDILNEPEGAKIA